MILIIKKVRFYIYFFLFFKKKESANSSRGITDNKLKSGRERVFFYKKKNSI